MGDTQILLSELHTEVFDSCLKRTMYKSIFKVQRATLFLKILSDEKTDTAMIWDL